jgi:hypothetical protein
MIKLAAVIYLAIGLVLTGIGYGATRDPALCDIEKRLFVAPAEGIVVSTFFWPVIPIAIWRSGCPW